MANIDLTPHLHRLSRQASVVGLETVKRSLESQGILISTEDLRQTFADAGFIETQTADHFILGNDALVKQAEGAQAHMQGMINAATNFGDAARALHTAVKQVGDNPPTPPQWVQIVRAADRYAGHADAFEVSRKNAIAHMRTPGP